MKSKVMEQLKLHPITNDEDVRLVQAAIKEFVEMAGVIKMAEELEEEFGGTGDLKQVTDAIETFTMEKK